MTLANGAYLVLGLIVLVVGAEGLVRGASRLAARAGIPALIIGLTVVAFGTSAPELAVSITSALKGQPNLVLGNVVGSNIFNVLFVLGISAAIAPLIVAQQLVRWDVPILVGVSFALLFFARDGQISRAEGGLLFAGFIAYTLFQVWQARRETNATVKAEYEGEFALPAPGSEAKGAIAIVRDVAFVLGGLALLVLGARWLVSSAVAIAQSLGVSELIIGLTIVAAGTSLPEVATSVIASLRGERDIAVGNAVGSNIFNILTVLGLATFLSPAGVQVADEAQRFDIPVMTAVAVACLPIFFTGHVIARWEGILFLGYYVAYTIYLVLVATQSPTQAAFGTAMLWFVLPLTLVTLALTLWRALRPAPTTAA
jgi:cation:H+ antiporter